jgi:hypothetical protein
MVTVMAGGDDDFRFVLIDEDRLRNHMLRFHLTDVPAIGTWPDLDFFLRLTHLGLDCYLAPMKCISRLPLAATLKANPAFNERR